MNHCSVARLQDDRMNSRIMLLSLHQHPLLKKLINATLVIVFYALFPENEVHAEMNRQLQASTILSVRENNLQTIPQPCKNAHTRSDTEEHKCCTVQRSAIWDGATVVQVFCLDKNNNDIYLRNDREGSLVPLYTSESDELLYIENEETGTERVRIIKVEGNDNARYLFNAYFLYNQYLKHLNYEVDNDFTGQLSWNISRYIVGLSELYKKTQDCTLKWILFDSINEVLNAQNRHSLLSDEFNPGCGWSSKIYSIDGKTNLTLLVNQGMIMFSLLKACENLGDRCPLSILARVKHTGICLFEYFMLYFDYKVHLFRFQKNIPHNFDGIWAPWNAQLLWAATMYKLSLLTGNERYSQYSEEVVKAFLDEIEFYNNGIIWYYWSWHYYRGWSSEDALSVNVPEKEETIPTKYDDVSHGSLSVMALLEMKELIPLDIDSYLNSTLDALMRYRPHFPQYIDAQQHGDFGRIPRGGWVALNNSDLSDMYQNLLPTVRPKLRKTTMFSAYASLYDDDDEFDLNIQVFSCDQSTWKQINNCSFESASDFLNEIGCININD